MKKEMKDRINSLDPIVKEKLLKRLVAEKIAKQRHPEINFNENEMEYFKNLIYKDKISNDKIQLSELQKKALLVKLMNSKPPQNLIDEKFTNNEEVN